MKSRFAHFSWAFDKALVEVGAFKEEIELSLGENEITGMEGINPGEETLFEPFADEYEACAVVVQTLAGSAAFIEENKQVTRKGVLFDHIFDATKEGVVTCPHVCRFFTKENFCSAV